MLRAREEVPGSKPRPHQPQAGPSSKTLIVHIRPAQPSPFRDPKARGGTEHACVQEQLWGMTLTAQEGTVKMSLGEQPVILMKLKLHVTSDLTKRTGV